MLLIPLPHPRRKVCLWHIFFALPAMNGPLPAELKFRENTVYASVKVVLGGFTNGGAYTPKEKEL